MTGNNWAKFGHVVSEICWRTDRQTDMLAAILRTPTEVKILKNRRAYLLRPATVFIM